MKPLHLIACAALLSMTATTATAWERITTEQQFRDRIADRTLVMQNGWTTSHGDGRITGEFNGQRMVGRWQWHQGFWCRNFRNADGTETGTDCQVLDVRGNQLRNTRNQGRGDSVVLTIQ
jgi:hypothetical protein